MIVNDHDHDYRTVFSTNLTADAYDCMRVKPVLPTFTSSRLKGGKPKGVMMIARNQMMGPASTGKIISMTSPGYTIKHKKDMSAMPMMMKPMR